MEFILTFWGSTAKGLANLRRLKARPSTARVLARRAQAGQPIGRFVHRTLRATPIGLSRQFGTNNLDREMHIRA